MGQEEARRLVRGRALVPAILVLVSETSATHEVLVAGCSCVVCRRATATFRVGFAAFKVSWLP